MLSPSKPNSFACRIAVLTFSIASGYSSLIAGRPKTPSEGWIYLHFEGGPGGGSQVARFNLSWLLAGESTGDGVPPDWASTGGGAKE